MSVLEFVEELLFGSRTSGKNGLLRDVIEWKNRLIGYILLIYSLFFFIGWIGTYDMAKLGWATGSLSLALTIMLRAISRWPLVILDFSLGALNVFLWLAGAPICSLFATVCLLSGGLAILPQKGIRSGRNY